MREVRPEPNEETPADEHPIGDSGYRLDDNTNEHHEDPDFNANAATEEVCKIRRERKGANGSDVLDRGEEPKLGASRVVKVASPLFHCLQTVEQRPVITIDRRTQEENGHHQVEVSEPRLFPPCHLGYVEFRLMVFVTCVGCFDV